MAKFRFAFETVLRHRQTMEDLAQKDFQEAMSFLSLENKKLEDLQNLKHEAFQNRHQKEVQGGAQGPALTQVHDFLKGQDLRIDQQKKKIQAAEKLVEERREVLRQKRVETKIIEGLRERKLEEFKREQGKLEQKRTDDMMTTRFKRTDQG